MKDNFHPSRHPLVKHKLTHMRRHAEDVPSREFVRLMREMGRLLAYEVTQDLVLPDPTGVFRTQNTGKNPPLSEIPAATIGPRKPVIVPILRGGLVLAEGLQDVIPTTYTGHIGMHYNEEVHSEPAVYLVALPEDDLTERLFILADPVVATGVTACRAISILLEFDIQPENIRFTSIVVSEQGKTLIQKLHPKVHVFCAAIDERLEKSMVIPGLGSISSRLYRTA